VCVTATISVARVSGLSGPLRKYYIGDEDGSNDWEEFAAFGCNLASRVFKSFSFN